MDEYAPAAADPMAPGSGSRTGRSTSELAERLLGAREFRWVVRGAPGTGKSSLAAELVLAQIRAGGRPERTLLLAPSRAAATRLRAELDTRLETVTTGELARSWSSLAFDILQRRARLLDEPAPRLLSGPEQDVLLGEILRNNEEDGFDARWPRELDQARGTRGFRAELRDLVMRAAEHALSPADLAALATAHGREDWQAAARVYDQYLAVTTLSSPPGLDPATLLVAAADALDPLDDADPAETALAEAVRGGLDLVVVDDAQELSHSAARLVRLLAGAGTRAVLIGDADAAVEGFRGGDATVFGRLGQEWGAAEELLGTGHRVPAAIGAAAARLTAHLPAPGSARHRQAVPPDGGQVEVHVLASETGQATHIAATLRRWHLLDGVPYQEMAVVLRGRGGHEALRRALSHHGVPLDVVGGGIALRDEPAVWPLLSLYRVALDLAGDRDVPLTAEEAEALLGSCVGRASAVDQRRLRRVLRREARDAGLAVPTADLVTAACLDRGALPLSGPELEPARRVSRAIEAGRQAAAAEGATAHTILWAIWAATGLQEPWRQTALRGGPAGRRADLDLDAVVAVLRTAEQYVERLPQESPETLLTHLTSQDIAADSLAARAPSQGSVTLTTAQGAAGRGWRRVIVAGVQEGTWPDLRLRGSLLGSEELVDAVLRRDGSVRARQAATRADELRSFHVALTRASERVLVTCVAGPDQQPSPFIDLVDPLPDGTDTRPVQPVEPPLTVTTVVAEARRTLHRTALARRDGATGAGDEIAGADAAMAAAAARLAALAGLAPAADPAHWWGLRTPSDDRPLVPDGAPVPVSPSRVELFATCPLRWLLQSRGGDPGTVQAASLGSLVHAVIEADPHGSAEALVEDLRARWTAADLGDGWYERSERSRAEAMLERYVEYHRAVAGRWSLAGVELGVEVEVGRARVRGRIDRVETDGRGHVRVVDLKTGKAVVTKAAAQENPQLGIYQLAAERDAIEACPAGPGSARGAALLYLDTGATREQDPPGDGEFFAETLVAEAAEGMAQPVQPARPGTACRSCPVRSSCPAQAEGEDLR